MSTSFRANAVSHARLSQPMAPRRTGIALALLAAFGSHGMAHAATQIIPTGKTSTVVTPGANGVTAVTTQTIKNNVGLNAFSQFKVDQGDVVNLHVPASANMLLNVVYDSPILINGIVNGVKDGALGGKIAFADPHGMVVGASGVLNLGSLTVLTPSASALSSLIDAGGGIDGAAMDKLLAGQMAVSADGHITINGTVNALDAISLRGNLVDVGGTLTASAAAAQQAAFAAAVNTTGLQPAQRLSVQDGVIEIVGATINVTQGASIQAGMGSGTVNLAAASSDVEDGAADRSAAASLNVNGRVAASSLALSATAVAGSDNTGTGAASFRDAEDAAGNALGFRWADATVTASAKVTIGAHADLHAGGDIAINADSTQTNKLRLALGDSLNPGANSLAAHGSVDGGAEALVQDHAVVDAGGKLSVIATNNSTLAVQTSVLSYTADLGMSLASGESHLATSATVQGGATLSAGSGVDVVGRSTSNYSVQASSGMNDGGKAGIAGALSAMHETSDALLGANVNTSGSVRVQADTIVDQNFTKASTDTGSGLVSGNVAPWIVIGATNNMNDFTTTGTSLLVNAVDAANKRASLAAGGQPETTTQVKLGAAVSLVDDSFGAHASVAPGVALTSTAGDAVVAARVEDHQVHNIAQSAVNSATSASAATPIKTGAQLSGSAGVAIAFLDHDAGATVGDGASIDAQHIGVDSSVLLPLDITWLKWDGFSKLTGYLSPKLGVPEKVLTSYANASGEATEGALAGAFNWVDVGNSSRAWVGKNANLTAHASAAAYTTPLQGAADAKLALPASITVHAANRVETVDIAGNVSAMLVSGTGGGDGTTAVGGAFGGVHYQNTTTAAVYAGASLASTNGALLVRAESDDKAFVVAPSTGGGSSISGNGAMAYSKVDNRTTAAISNQATVNTDAASVDAHESLAIWTVAGGVARSSADSVGAGIAYNELNAATSAMVGDISSLATAGAAAQGAVPGSITTAGALTVTALTDGQANALSAAGAEAAQKPVKPAQPGSGVDDEADATAELLADHSADWGPSKADKAKEVLRSVLGRAKAAESAAADTPTQQPSFMLAAAGSASINNAALATRATVDASTVHAGSMTLAAAANADLNAASGAAAMLSVNAGRDRGAAAIAGAIAVDLEHNTTVARATGVDYSGGGVSIDALSTGQHGAVGLGVAKNGQDEGDSASVAGSVSVVQSHNTTEAGALRSDFTVTGGGDVDVLAYDRTDINAGGVSVALGGNAGVGAAVTYADIGNTVNAHLDGADIQGAAGVTVAALQPARIVAAALEGAATGGKAALGGSAVVASVSNTTSASIDAARASDGTVLEASEVHADKVKVAATDDAGKEGLGQLAADGRAIFGMADRIGLFDFDVPMADGISLRDSSGIVTLAGAVESGKTAVGAAVAYNVIGNTTTALATGTIVTGSLVVRASDSAVIAGLAAGAAIGGEGGAAGLGSATANVIDNTTSATLGGGADTSVSAEAGRTVDVTVGAEAASSITAGAGSLAIGKGTSVGAAVAVNTNTSHTSAEIGHTVIADGGAVTVDARQTTTIRALAAAVAASAQENALAGSYTQNEIADVTTARWSQSDLNRGSAASQAVLDIGAGDRSTIESLAGGAAASLDASGAAGGAALSVNRIDNQVEASLLGGDLAGHASNVRAKSVKVEAVSAEIVRSIAVALGAAGKVGVGGSSATTISGSSTSARIDQGANVLADHNVGVIAANTNTVSTFAGGVGVGLEGGGVGVSTAINLLDDSTGAAVGGTGPTTSVTALGSEAGDVMRVASGELAAAPSLLSSLDAAGTLSVTGLAGQHHDITGLAVNASNLATVGSVAVSAGAGKAGIAGTATTTRIGGVTSATMTDARINQDGVAAAGSGVDVQASSHVRSADINGSLGLGNVAVGLALDIQALSGQTSARVQGGTLDAGALTVDARQSASVAAVGGGVAVGGNGGAGTGQLVQLSGAVAAELLGTAATADSVAVKASSTESAHLIGGAIAGAANVGLGGAFGVIDARQTTLAGIGDAGGVLGTRVKARGAVGVDATTTMDNNIYAASGGVAGEVGVGLSAGVILDENSTTARLTHVKGSGAQPGLDTGGALSVTASEQDCSTQGIGALGAGVGAVGVGASVAVTETRAQVAAQIADSTTSSASVAVKADNTQRIDSKAAAAGGGMYVGVGGAVSVVQLGSGDSGASTGDSLGRIDAMLDAPASGDRSALSADEAAALDGGGHGIGAAGMLAAGQRNSASATVTHSGLVTTGSGGVDVAATALSGIGNTVGGLAVGAVGAGGSAAVSAMYNSVEAGVDAGSSIATAGDLRVHAASGDAGSAGIESRAYAGSGGIVGLGAAVGLATIDNAVAAHAGGTLAAGGSLQVGAADSASIDAQGISVMVGGVVAGLTYVEAQKGGSVQAVLAADAATARVIDVSADSRGAVKAKALVGAAGIGPALGANHASASDKVDTGATLGGAVDAVDVTVAATRTPQVSAATVGGGVSASVQVGLSHSEADIAGATRATVLDNTRFGLYGGAAAGGSLAVQAHNQVAAGSASADADASATGGGVLAGLNGAMATAGNSAAIAARIGDGVTLPIGDMLVDAHNVSSQRADASGNSAGMVSGGGSLATASSAVDVSATVGNGARNPVLQTAGKPDTLIAAGELVISANGSDDNRADAQAGAGGALAGAAALATTRTGGSTDAALGGAQTGQNPLLLHALYIDSSHSATFLSSGDASQASVAGGSGVDARSSVNTRVAATVGSGAKVSAGDIAVEATNTVREAGAGSNASGVSGGAVAGAGMNSTNTIATVTSATVGSNARLAVDGDPLGTPGNLRIGAGTVVAGADSATVDGGGAVALLSASSSTDMTSTTTVDVGSGAALSSVGDLGLGTWTMANISNDADVHAYGLAGGAGGSARSDITSTQAVNVGTGAKLDSWGNMGLTSGRSPDAAWTTSLVARATNQVYGDGAVSRTDPSANATVINSSSVNVADGAVLNSVRDIALAAPAGTSSVSATGEGHYRVLGIPFTNSNGSANTGGTQSVRMDGSASAGTRHEVTLAIGADGSYTNKEIAHDIDDYDPVGQLTTQVTQLTALMACKDAATQGDIQAQIDALTGLIKTLQGRGLAAGSKVKAVEVNNTLAAGGNIDIDARTLTGRGTLNAWGGPTITLTNDSSKFLVVDKLLIPNELGGNIRYSGGTLPATLTANAYATNAPAAITISNNYDSAAPGAARAPAIFLTSSIENIGGALSIYNKSGDLGQFGAVNVNNEQILVPNGAYIVNTPANGYFLNGDPQGQFVSSNGEVFMLDYLHTLGDAGVAGGVALPGGANPLLSPSSMTSDAGGGHGAPGSAEEAVTYVANYIAKSKGYTGTDLGVYFANGLGQFSDEGQMPLNLTSTMFFYIGSALADNCATCGRSSPEYVAAYTGDHGFYDTHHSGTFRYYYPSIASRDLTNEVAVLAPAAATAKTTQIGTSAIINAKFIDINDTIQVGLPSDFSATIARATIKTGVDAHGTVVQRDLIDCVNDPACKPTAAGLLSNGLYKYGTSVASDGSTPIDVYYDPARGQLVLQSINGGGSGSISLHGAIINTNAGGGAIEVSNGYAHVTVQNNSGVPLLTSDINTGDGNVGMVKITDTLKTDNQGRAQTTWYVNQLGTGLKTYQSYSASDYTGLAPVSASLATGATYNPLYGERYYWQYDANLSRTFSLTTNDWYDASMSAWTWNGVGANAGATLGGVWKITSGVVNDTSLEHIAFQETISGAVTNHFVQPVHYTEHGDWNWNWDIITGVSIKAYNSVKADNPIAIKFTGANTAGLVDIQSNSAVTVGGTIQNTGGATKIAATGANATIDANAKGVVNTQSLELAAQGGIGSLAAPLTVNLGNAAGTTGLNTVSATTTGGNIGLALKGADALIRKVDAGAGGDVLLHGSASLLNGASGGAAAVSGRNLTITSDNGTVGSAGQALAIQAIAGTDGGGVQTDGVVNAGGQGGVYLRQTAGDLYIGHVTSPGQVSLQAAGSVLDGRSIASTGKDDERAALWDRMQLTETARHYAAGTKALADRVTAQYKAYQALLAMGSVSGGVFTLGDAAVQLMQRQADAALGTSATRAQVMALAQSQYDSLHGALLQAGVTDFTVSADKFVPDPSGFAALRSGQYWTADNLQYQINAAALNPVSGEVVKVADPGIIGAKVTLLSTGGNIGSLGQTLHFVVNADGTLGALNADGTVGALDSAHKAALLSATAAGDLTLHYANGAACAGAACQLLSFDVGQTNPLEVQAGQGLDARATGGSIYLAAKDALAIERIAAAADVRISSENGMRNLAGAQTAAIQAGRDIVLLNGSGDIGSAGNFMTVAAGNAVTLASSGGGMYLQAPNGDLSFGKLSASGLVSLKAGAGDIRSVNADDQGTALPSLAADALLLDTSGSVYQQAGGQRGALLTQLGDSNADGSAGTVGTVGGTVRGKLDLANDRTFRLEGLAVGGHAALTALSGNLQAGYVSGPDLALSAQAGKIVGVASTLGNGENVHSTGSVTLTGDSGIGEDAATRLVVATRTLDATSTGGDMYIGLSGAAGAGITVNALAHAGSTLDIAAATDFTAAHLVAEKGTDADDGADIHLSTSGKAVATLAGIDAGRDLYLDTIDGQFHTTAGGSVGVARDLHLTMTGNGVMDDSATSASGLRAGRDIVMNAAAMNLGKLEAARNIDLTARSGNLAYRDLTAHGDVLLHAEGAVKGTSGGTLSASGDVRIEGSALTLNNTVAGRDAALTVNGGALAVNAGGAIAVGRDLHLLSTGCNTLSAPLAGHLNAARDITIDAAALDQLDASAGGSLSVTARSGDLGYVHLDARGGDVLASAVGQIAGTPEAVIHATRDVLLDAAGIAAAQIEAGRDASLAASGALLVNDLRAGAKLDAQAGGTLQVGRAVIGAGATLAGTDVTLGAIDAATLAVQADRNLAYTTLTVGQGVRLDAGGQLNGGVLGAGGDVTASSAGLAFTGITAGGKASLTSTGSLSGSGTLQAASIGIDAAGDVRLHQATSIGDAAIGAGGSLAVEQLTAASVQLKAGGDALVASLDAGTAAIEAGAKLDLAQAEVRGDLAASAVNLDVGTAKVGGNTVLDATGSLLVHDLRADGALDAHAGGAVQIQRAAIKAGATLAAADMTLGAIDAAGLSAHADGNLAYTRLTVGQDVSLDAGAQLNGGVLEAGGDVVARSTGLAFIDIAAGGKASLASAGDIIGSGTLQAATIGIDAAGDVRLHKASSTGDAVIGAGGSLAVERLTATQTAQMKAGGDVHVAALDAGTAAIEAGARLDLTQAEVRGNLAASGATVDVGTANVGGNAALDASGSMLVQDIGAGGKLDAQAGGTLQIERAVIKAGATLAGADMSLGAIEVTDLSAHAGGNLAYTTLTVGQDVGLDAGAQLNGGRLGAGGNVTAHSAGLVFTDITAGGKASLTSTGDVTGSGILQAASIGIDADRDVRLHQATSTGDAVIGAGGSLAVEQLTVRGDLAASGVTLDVGMAKVGGNAVLDASGSMLVQDLSVGGKLDAQAGSTLQIERAVSKSAASLAGTEVTLGAIDAAGLSAHAGGNLAYTALTVGQNVNLDAGAQLNGGVLVAGGDVTTRSAGQTFADITAGGKASLVATGSVTGSGTLQAAAIGIDAGDDVRLHEASSASDAVIGAGGRLVVEQLTATETAQLKAGGDVHVTSLDAGMAAIEAGAKLALAKADVRGDLAASGAMLDVGMAKVGGNAVLDASDRMLVQDLNVGGKLDAQAGSTLQIEHAVSKSAAGLAGTDMTLGAMDAAALSAHAGGNLAYTALRVGQSVNLDAGGQLNGGVLDAGGDVTARSAGLAFTDITAGGKVSLVSAGGVTGSGMLQAAAIGIDTGGDVRLHQAASGGDAVIGAAGSLAVDQLTAAETAQLKVGGDAVVASLDAGTAAIKAGANLDLAQADVRGDLAVSGVNLDVGSAKVGGNTVLDASGSMLVHDLNMGGQLDAQAGSTLQIERAVIKAGATLAGAEMTLGAIDAAGLSAHAGGNLAYTALTVGQDVNLDAGNQLHGGALEAGGDVMTRSAGMAFADIAAGGKASLASTGSVTGSGTLQAATIGIDAAGDVSLHQATSAGDAVIDSGGNLSAGRLTAAGSLQLKAGGKAGVALLDAGTTTIVAGAAVDLAQARVRGDLTASGTALGVGTATVGNNAVLAATAGDVTETGALQAASFTIDATGDVRLHQASSTGDATIGAAGNIAVSQIAAGGEVRLTAAGGIELAQATVQGKLVASAASVSVGTASVSGDAAFNAAAGLALGSIRTGGTLAADAGNIVFDDLTAGTAARLNASSGGITGSGTVQANGVAIDAAHDATIQRIVSSGDASLRAGGTVSVASGDVAGTLDSASAQLAFGTVHVHGDGRMATSAIMQADALTVDGQVKASAGTAMNLSSLTAGRDIGLTAQDIRIGDLEAGRDGTLTAANAITGGVLSAANDLTLSAGTTIDVASATAGGRLQLDSRQGINVGAMWAASMAASTPGVLRIDELSLQQSAVLSAGTVDAGIRQAGPQGLTLSVSGYQGGVADTVDLRVDAPAGLGMPTLRARSASVTSTAHANRIDRGFVTGTLQFATPDGVMLMNNRNPASVRGLAIQLFAPGDAFMFVQEGSQYLTDAYVTQYVGAARPTVPNYQDSHATTNVMAYGASAARDLEREAVANRLQSQPIRLAAIGGSAPAPVVAAPGQAAVNLGDGDGLPREQDVIFETSMETE